MQFRAIIINVQEHWSLLFKDLCLSIIWINLLGPLADYFNSSNRWSCNCNILATDTWQSYYCDYCMIAPLRPPLKIQKRETLRRLLNSLSEWIILLIVPGWELKCFSSQSVMRFRVKPAQQLKISFKDNFFSFSLLTPLFSKNCWEGSAANCRQH